MTTNQTLEERAHLLLSTLRDCLRYGHGLENFNYGEYDYRADNLYLIRVKSEYSCNPWTPTWVGVGVIETSMIDGRSVVDNVRICPGPVHDIVYLEASSRLRKALESEGIPFTDERNHGKLREEADGYIKRLQEALERLL